MVTVYSGRWIFPLVILFCLLFYDVYFRSLDADASIISRFAFCCCVLVTREASWYCTKLQTLKSAVYHGSPILSADFLGQLNYAHKSWPTLSIVWHPLNMAKSLPWCKNHNYATQLDRQAYIQITHKRAARVGKNHDLKKIEKIRFFMI